MIQVIKWGNSSIAKYSERMRSEVADELASGSVSGVAVTPDEGCSDEVLQSLVGLPNLKILVVQRLPDVAVSALEQLPCLEEVSIDETKQTLDLGRLPRLKRLSVFWHRRIFLNEANSKVESLHVWKYRAADLSDFPAFPNLAELELVKSNVKSLSGVAGYPGLKRLELHRLDQLEQLTDLGLQQLVSFVAADCKKIEDHEHIASCKKLQELKLHRCGVMKSIDFIRGLRDLQSFRFLGTPIADGDYSPLLRLEDVYFTENRKLNVKPADFHQRRST
jgi:Leucine-rich repeat (LRR) protein